MEHGQTLSWKRWLSGPVPARARLFWRHGDRLFWSLTVVAGVGIVALVAGIGYELWLNSALARHAFGWSFILSSRWDPAIDQSFGALPFLQGTLITSAIALLVAVPVGVGAAIFLAELSPAWVRQPLGFLVELLAAIPSVVYGLWGLFAFIPVFLRPLADSLNRGLGFLPLFEGPVFGPSRLAAGLLLAIMILPIVAAVSRDVFRAIPVAQREAALALGATRWEMISQVLIPYGRSGLLGAVILGLGRALGETIAVTMVIGNNLDLTASLLHPGYTMASIIANEFTEATYDLYLHALIEVGLILFFITLVVNLLARLLVWGVARRGPQEEARA
jgi:phosphate transport system permease protein